MPGPPVLPPPPDPAVAPRPTGRLRALGLAELLDAAFTLYRRNFAVLVAIAAVLQVPAAVLQLILLGAATVEPSADAALITETLALSAAEFFLIQPLVQAAATRAVSDRYLDRPTSVSVSYRHALRRLRSLVAMSLELILLVVALLLPLAVLGGLSGQPAILAVLIVSAIPALVYGFVRTAFAAPAIVIEGISGWRGIRRSWGLTEGSWWRLFGILLLVGLLVASISATTTGLFRLPSLALDPVPRAAYSTVVSTAVSVFVAPVQLIVVTLLYYDLRIRREAFDIEILAASL